MDVRNEISGWMNEIEKIMEWKLEFQSFMSEMSHSILILKKIKCESSGKEISIYCARSQVQISPLARS